MVSTAVEGIDNYTHGAERELACLEPLESSAKESISCQDGIWNSPAVMKCVEKTHEIWRASLALSNGDLFDYTIVPIIVEAWALLMDYLVDQIDTTKYRVAAAGSCKAMTSINGLECVDNVLVESMGFGCSLLAGVGCQQSLAELSALQGVAMPAGIPGDALVLDACPVTCNACAEAMVRLSDFASQASLEGSPAGVECFKVDLMVEYSGNLPSVMKLRFGSLEDIDRLLSAGFRDSLTKSPKLIYTNWTAEMTIVDDTAVLPRVQKNAMAYVIERPVDVFLLAPISEGTMAFGGDSFDANSTVSDLPPFEKKRVPISQWNSAYHLQREVLRAKAITKNSGISKGIDFSMTEEDLEKFMTPRPGGSQGWIGRYLGTAPYGSLIKPRLSSVCSGDCCKLKAKVQEFLDGPCGLSLYSTMPSESEMAEFCRVPYRRSTEFSCMSKALMLIYDFRDRSEAGCEQSKHVMGMFESWCAVDPLDNGYCLLKMDSDLTKFSFEQMSLKTADELDNLCYPASCLRSHFTYLDAVTQLTIYWNQIITSGGRRLDEQLGARRFLVPLSYYGIDIMNLICMKVNGDYCQQTLQLLAEDDPVTSPDIVAAPCASQCFVAAVGVLGGVVEKQAHQISSPRHLAMGSLLRHYSRFGCSLNKHGKRCLAQSFGDRVVKMNFTAYKSKNFTVNRCTSCPSTYIGDGQCDMNCFNAECGFDGGDCVFWNQYPQTVAKLVENMCLQDLNDPCNPLSSNFECSSCRLSISNCVEKMGCCFSTAVETLQNSLKLQRDIMISDIGTMGETFYDDFDLDSRIIENLERTCGLNLDRLCDGGTSQPIYRIAVEVPNLKPVQPILDGGSGKLKRQLATGIDQVDSYILNAELIDAVAKHFHLIPTDLSTSSIRKIGKNTPAQIRFVVNAGSAINDINLIQYASVGLLETVMSEISLVPEYRSMILDRSKPVSGTLHNVVAVPRTVPVAGTLSTRTVGSEAAISTGEPCLTTDLWKVAQRGMILGSSYQVRPDAVTAIHGVEVPVQCLTGYISSESNGNLVCDDGVWVALNGFSCGKTCPQGPLDTLGLDSYKIEVVSDTATPLKRLFGPQDLAKQSIETPGNKYPPGSAILLSCKEGFTANISSSWGLALTHCENGKWTPVPIHCESKACFPVSFVARQQVNALRYLHLWLKIPTLISCRTLPNRDSALSDKSSVLILSSLSHRTMKDMLAHVNV